MNITHLLTIQKDDLIDILKLSSTKSGSHSYLFVPEVKENKVCLVAHIDTVWDESTLPNKPKAQSTLSKKAQSTSLKQSTIGNKLLIHDTKKGLIYSPNGLGADDRAGVYGVLKLLSTIPEPNTPYVLLTDLEESGGAGAYEAVDLYREELANCTMFIELDRRGANDCVFYNSEHGEFASYIESFGFVEASGTFSDISIIAPEFERCAVNLSIGYYNEHTSKEYLNTNEMEVTIARTRKLIKDATKKAKHWEHIFTPTRWGYGSEGSVWSDKDFIDCTECGELYFLDDMELLQWTCTKCEAKLSLLNVGI